MKILKRLRKLNNKGVTIVELICALAIMSIVGAAAASIMVVCANTYSSSTSDAGLQSDAQAMVNQIGNLIQDATDVSVTGSVLKIEKGAEVYEISYDSATKTVFYSKDGGAAQPMADKVSKFIPDAANFADTGIVTMDVELADSARNYASNYTIAARNVPVTIHHSVERAQMDVVEQIVLEPNQSYDLHALVTGASVQGVNFQMVNNLSTATVLSVVDDNNCTITVGRDETAPEFEIVCKSMAKKADGVTDAVRKTVKVHVRRVNEMNLYVTRQGTDRRAGCKYTLTAELLGTNLTQFDPALVPNDVDYCNHTKDVYWNYDFYHINSSGNVVHNPSEYVDFEVHSDGSSMNPYLVIKLKKDLPENDHITVNAIAEHPEGTLNQLIANVDDPLDTSEPFNKTSSRYTRVYKQWDLNFSFLIPVDNLQFRRGSDDKICFDIDVDKIKQRAFLEISSNGSYRGDYNQFNNDNQLVKMYRYREQTGYDATSDRISYGAWTGWRYEPGEMGGNAITFRAIYILRPELYYEFEYKVFIQNKNTKQIIWPTDSMPEQQKQMTMLSGVVDPVIMKYNVSSNGTNISDADTFAVNVNAGNRVNVRGNGVLAVAGNYFNQNNITYYIQRAHYNEDGTVTWESALPADAIVVRDGYNQSGSFQLPNYYVEVYRKGTYRVYSFYKDYVLKVYNPSMESMTNPQGAYTSNTYVSFDMVNPYMDTKGYNFFVCGENSNDWDNKYIEYKDVVYEFSVNTKEKKENGKTVYYVTGKLTVRGQNGNVFTLSEGDKVTVSNKSDAIGKFKDKALDYLKKNY